MYKHGAELQKESLDIIQIFFSYTKKLLQGIAGFAIGLAAMV